MIAITEKAVAKLKELAQSEGFAPTVRCVCKGGSCAGLTGDLLLEEVINETDDLFEQDGLKIVVDQCSVHYLENAVIDYVDDGFTSGFKFLFKDEKVQSCGCQSSWGYS